MKILISYILISCLGLASSYPETATTILSKVDQTVFSVKDKTADVEMQMINLKTGKKKIKKALLLQKGMDKKLFRYTYPASDDGIATLTVPEGVYLYLPMFKKPKKVTNLAESNALNKSDFSLEDAITKPYSQIFTPKLAKTTSTHYIIDLIPKDKSSSYSHIKATINKSHFYPEKMEYFDLNNQKVKVATNKYIKMGNYWVVSAVSMKNIKKNHMTKFLMTNIKINSGLKDDLFTVENMVKK